MPDLHRNMQPGAPMTFHVSLGLTIRALIVLRLAWRLAHPVAPESSLPSWQRLSSELVHWMLYPEFADSQPEMAILRFFSELGR
jgi:cytochrome b561